MKYTQNENLSLAITLLVSSVVHKS